VQIPEFHQRVGVLQRLGYVSPDGTVTLKGRAACEINSTQVPTITVYVSPCIWLADSAEVKHLSHAALNASGTCHALRACQRQLTLQVHHKHTVLYCTTCSR
jgi:superfamily II RNA helicase